MTWGLRPPSRTPHRGLPLGTTSSKDMGMTSWGAPLGNQGLECDPDDPPRSEATRTGAPPGRGGSEDRPAAASEARAGPGRRAERGRYITSVLGRSQVGHKGSWLAWPMSQADPAIGRTDALGTALTLERPLHVLSSSLSTLSRALSIPRAAAPAGAGARACPCPWTRDHRRTVRTVEADHVGDI